MRPGAGLAQLVEHLICKTVLKPREISASPIFLFSIKQLRAIGQPAFRLSHVTVGDLWELSSQTFSAAAMRFVSSAAE